MRLLVVSEAAHCGELLKYRKEGACRELSDIGATTQFCPRNSLASMRSGYQTNERLALDYAHASLHASTRRKRACVAANGGMIMKTTVAAAFIATLMASTAYGSEVTGYLYTTLNGETTNQVIAIERHDDGTLGKQVAYSTRSLGGANRSAGGDAAGDFDAQGAVQIIGDYLLAVNAGGNTISVFDLERSDGSLTHAGNVASGGTRPVSIAYQPDDEVAL